MQETEDTPSEFYMKRSFNNFHNPVVVLNGDLEVDDILSRAGLVIG